MALQVLVDAEKLVSEYLRARPEVTELVGNRTYTEIPAEPAWPIVVLHRFGGTPKISEHLDVAHIHFDAYGGSKFEARRLAATVFAAVHDLPKQGVLELGVVTDVRNLLGLVWSRDPETNRARYLFELAIDIHPKPT